MVFMRRVTGLTCMGSSITDIIQIYHLELSVIEIWLNVITVTTYAIICFITFNVEIFFVAQSNEKF